MRRARSILSKRIGLRSAALAPMLCELLDVYEGRIQKASRASEAATTDTERAAAYADRGRGDYDKARLSLLRKVIGHDGYVRLFDLAFEDHDRAVALDPGNAGVHRSRTSLKEKRYGPAAADLDKSVEPGAPADGCSREPYDSLAFIYIGTQPQYEKDWDLAREAERAHRPIAPEYVERSKKMPGK